jgi:hypothetical protein
VFVMLGLMALLLRLGAGPGLDQSWAGLLLTLSQI